MKRRLVKQGDSTMMISLPSSWIHTNNLKKGDEIDLVEKDNRILIGTKISEKKEIIIVANSENKKDLRNLLTHIYRRGFDKIILKNFEEKNKEIKEITNNLLLGFEVTEINKEKIIVENISEPESEKFELMLRKAFQIVEETQKILKMYFEENSFFNIKEIEELKSQQDRFLLFCRRILMKGGTDKSLVFEWEILNFLMHVEHRYYYLYLFISKIKSLKKNGDVIFLLNKLIEYFEFYKNAYYTKNIEYVHKINSLKKEYYLGKCISSLEKSKGTDNVILAYIREIFRIIQLGTSPILVESLENSLDSKK